MVFGILLASNWLARHVRWDTARGHGRPRWQGDGGARPVSLARLVPAYALGCLMVIQAFGDAYFQLNGEHTRTYRCHSSATTTSAHRPMSWYRTARPPDQAVRDRLEADAFRSGVVSAPDGYPTYDAPSERGYASFVSVFWRLRLVNGYPILSRRIAALPWPEAAASRRAISFADQQTLPWSLLAILNVKYAVVANPSLLFNVPANPAHQGDEARPEDLTVLENPLPVVPRAFFAASVTPRAQATPVVTDVPAPPAAVRTIALSDARVAITWTSEIADATYEVYGQQVSPTPQYAPVLVARDRAGRRRLRRRWAHPRRDVRLSGPHLRRPRL